MSVNLRPVSGDFTGLDDAERLAWETYRLGWLASDKGGSYAAKRRRFSVQVGGHPEALRLWEAGWSDLVHARGFGASKDPGNKDLPVSVIGHSV
jgi:hypothetical protein